MATAANYPSSAQKLAAVFCEHRFVIDPLASYQEDFGRRKDITPDYPDRNTYPELRYGATKFYCLQSQRAAPTCHPGAFLNVYQLFEGFRSWYELRNETDDRVEFEVEGESKDSFTFQELMVVIKRVVQDDSPP